MKRFALLSVVALMLASAVFAPVAMAQEPGDVFIQSVTLGPGGSLEVQGFIVCEQGAFYEIYLDARQTQGNQPVKSGSRYISDGCSTGGLTLFTVNVLPDNGSRPFRKGEVALNTARYYCGPSECSFDRLGVEVFEVPR